MNGHKQALDQAMSCVHRGCLTLAGVALSRLLGIELNVRPLHRRH